jgi:tRNA(adenine34) deaminase
MSTITQENIFSEFDHDMMTKARARARRSARLGEVPVGCIITDSRGTIIGAGHNTIENHQTQLAHAEIKALKQANKALNGWRLEDCTVYVTLEPCAMCLGALLLSRPKKIIYGARSPLFGMVPLHPQMPPAYTTHTTIVGGLQEAECSDILKHFFTQIRLKREDTP